LAGIVYLCCRRKIFTEQLPELFRPYAQRTTRLQKMTRMFGPNYRTRLSSEHSARFLAGSGNSFEHSAQIQQGLDGVITFFRSVFHAKQAAVHVEEAQKGYRDTSWVEKHSEAGVSSQVCMTNLFLL
jgi:hypothetical protein